MFFPFLKTRRQSVHQPIVSWNSVHLSLRTSFFNCSDAVQRNGMSGAGASSGSAANAVKRGTAYE